MGKQLGSQKQNLDLKAALLTLAYVDERRKGWVVMDADKVLDFEPEEEEVSENINYRKLKPQSTACPLCFEKLESKGALKRHRSKVHKGQSFTCKRCGKRFKSFNFLAKHYLKDHDKDTDSKTLYDETLVR